MLFDFLISCDIFLFGILICSFLHHWIFCFEIIPWQVVMICFVVALCSTLSVHMFSLKCWKYIIGHHATSTVNVKRCALFTLTEYCLFGFLMSEFYLNNKKYLNKIYYLLRCFFYLINS